MVPGTRRFVVLDALRGICALLLCLFHFRSTSPVADFAFVRQSWQFVDFFFVLSGFVIAANYRQRLDDGMSGWRFIGLRLGRIYPLHVFVLGLFVALEVAMAVIQPDIGGRQPFDAARDPAAIGSHLLLLQSIGLHDVLTWNGPSWSIATEFWTYVLFMLLVTRAGPRTEAWLVPAVVVCPLILLGATRYGINVAENWGMVRCIYGFGLGVLGWAAWRRYGRRYGRRPGRLWAGRGQATLVELATVGVVCTFVTLAGPTRWNLLGPPLFLVALLVFAREGGGVSRMLATPLPLWLGTLSYSIYMLHTFVQARMDDVLELVARVIRTPLTSETTAWNGTPITLVGADAVQGSWLTLAMLALVVGVAQLTYRYVELPGQRWSRAVFDPKTRHGPERTAERGEAPLLPG